MKIEALHDFFDSTYAEEWAKKFIPTVPRLALFDLILDQIKEHYPSGANILELGIGPGYLAHHIMSNSVNVVYEGLDFSEHQLKIAKTRLKQYHEHITMTQADLTDKNWTEKLSRQPDVIVSTWALHDLYSSSAIKSVYQGAFNSLNKRGLLLNGDFIKPELSTITYEGGRIKPSEHLQILSDLQFSNVKCIGMFEENISQPTTSNNYACFYATK